MQQLKMKIVGFDKLKSTLQIKFSSENAEKDIEEYPYHEFNVVEMHENITQEEVLKALALNGWNIALQQDIAEETARNSQKVAEYQSLIGEEFTYTDEDLFAVVPSERQPETENLMVI